MTTKLKALGDCSIHHLQRAGAYCTVQVAQLRFWCICLFTYLLTYLLTYSLAHSLTRSLTNIDWAWI